MCNRQNIVKASLILHTRLFVFSKRIAIKCKHLDNVHVRL